MSFSVSINKEINCIVIRALSNYDIEGMKAVREETIRLNTKYELDRVILDIRKDTSFINYPDMFNFIIELRGDVKIAILYSKTTKQDVDFIENVSNKRRKSIQIFTKEKKAIKWIKCNSHYLI
jgi:hypothetical protein